MFFILFFLPKKNHVVIALTRVNWRDHNNRAFSARTQVQPMHMKVKAKRLKRKQSIIIKLINIKPSDRQLPSGLYRLQTGAQTSEVWVSRSMKRASWNLAMKEDAFLSTSGSPTTQWHRSSSLGLTLLGLYFPSLSSSSSAHLKQKQEETLAVDWLPPISLSGHALHSSTVLGAARGQRSSFIAEQGFWASGGGSLRWCVGKGW